MKSIQFACLFIIVCLVISCGKGVKTDKAFVENVVKFYNEQQSVSYDINYKAKYFDADDTTIVKANVNLIKDVKDTVFGGKVWYNASIDSIYKNVEKYYNGSDLYVIKNDSGSIVRFDVKKGQTFAIEGSTDGDIKNVFFLKPEKLTEALNDSTIASTISDTIINKMPYANITLKYPDEDEFVKKVKKIFINKDTRLIDKITFCCHYQNQVQYNEWNLTNIKFNTVQSNALDKKLKAYLGKYKATDYQEPTAEETAPLAIGTKAPDFEAKLFSSGKAVKLSDYKGKIVVLDFWYMACHPCCQSIPLLNAIQQKHKDIVVLGVNPSDTAEKKIKKIPDFIKQYKINYLIAGIDNIVTKEYNIHGFPTLYIIDKNGLIQFAASGFNKEMEKALDEKINQLK